MENQKKNLSELAAQLEPVAEDQHGALIGGFASYSGTSMALQGENNFVDCTVTSNNCNGGNCTTGCGTTKG